MPTLKSTRDDGNISRRILRSTIVILHDTWLDAFVYKPSQNINTYTRWSLFLIGCLFLAITLGIDTPLHWLVLLPLTAIYLIQAAIIGFEPLYCFSQRIEDFIHKKPITPLLKTSH